MKRHILLLALAGFCFSAASAVAAPLKVTATLSTFADLVKSVGGEHVEVSSIASPKFNPHFIEPKPSDVLKVKRAELFVHAGLDLELWRGPLLDAAGNREVMPGGPRELALSQGIALLEVPDHPVSRAEGDIHIYGNPHYWVDPENARKMAKAICDKLSAVDPSHEADYRRNFSEWSGRLDGKISEWRLKLAPYQGEEVVGYHNSWPYFLRFSGMKMEEFLEPKPGIPPTPKQVQFIEQYIREKKIRLFIQETYFPQGESEALARQTGIQVLLLCQNVREVPEAADYAAMMDYNVNQLARALGAKEGKR